MIGVNEMLEVDIQGKEHINKNWSNQFGGLAVMHRANGHSIFSSPVLDQPELRDALSSLADLSLELISVENK